MQPARLFLAPVSMQGRSIVIDNKNFNFTAFRFVERIEDCEYVVLPHSIARVTPALRLPLDEAFALARTHGKELLIFFYGDLSYREHIQGAITFKWSAFRHSIQPGEIITPVFFDDLARETPILWRQKSPRPSVGFCGFAGFPSFKTRLKYYVDNAVTDGVSVVTGRPYLRAQKRGLYFRRKGIKILAADPRVDTRFIVRDSFFNQIHADPKETRREYLENLQNADFTLAPKGDPNTSTRFFEALSLGRIPILIDTETVLPLEKEIDYDSFILRVPHTEMHTLPGRILDLYESLSDDEFIRMQARARDAFVNYLQREPFFNRAFELLHAQGPDALN
jgi:hypothetical protein